jgi:hypothetical protein
MGDGTNKENNPKPSQKSQKGDKRHNRPSGSHNNSLNNDAAVPMLRFGVSNNFDTFRQRLSIACMEQYKNLGSLVVDKCYYVPPAIDLKQYNLANDLYEIEKGRLREAYKRQDKEIDDMRVDRTSMFAYFISKLNNESLDEIQDQPEWPKIEKSRDPLDLWLLIKSRHQILMTSKVAAVIKKTAREEYTACKQGPFEQIVDFKKRFDARLEALKASGNAEPSSADVAMDFLYSLDNSRYAEFKVEIVNDMQKGIATNNLDNLKRSMF